MNTPNFHFETCHRISTINSSFLLNSEKLPLEHLCLYTSYV